MKIFSEWTVEKLKDEIAEKLFNDPKKSGKLMLKYRNKKLKNDEIIYDLDFEDEVSIIDVSMKQK